MDPASVEAVYEHNAITFDEFYDQVDPIEMAEEHRDLDALLAREMRQHQVVRLIWSSTLPQELVGKRVLEIGGGNGSMTLRMLQKGAAHVTLQEIAPATERIATAAAAALGHSDKLDVRIGNPLEMDFGEPYDIVMCHLVFHHIPTEIEREFVKMLADNTAANGSCWVIDPCVNWPALDRVRWVLPASGRPSILSKEKFAEWKANDEHPDRDNSTEHIMGLFREQYGEVTSEVTGGLSRLHRWVDSEKYHDPAMRVFNRIDTLIPDSVQRRIAANHLIVARKPRHG
jgi:hypothetical protein